MIDNFALLVSHGLMLLAIWALLRRPDLDHEPGPLDRDMRGRLRAAKPEEEDRPVA
uniref:hypothetical protein n=1 Tax=Sphingomonas populi TaxID=2484750 RepID=UPI0013EEAC68|nr:hypothetical protein [Sphingomonas populi]